MAEHAQLQREASLLREPRSAAPAAPACWWTPPAGSSSAPTRLAGRSSQAATAGPRDLWLYGVRSARRSVSGAAGGTARPTPAAARGPSAEPRPSSLRAERAHLALRRPALAAAEAAALRKRPRRARPLWWRGRRPDMSPEAHRRHRCRGAARRPTVGRELGASNPGAPHRFSPPRRASTRALVSRAPQAATGASAPSTPEEQTSAGFLGQPGGGAAPHPPARPGSLGS